MEDTHLFCGDNQSFSDLLNLLQRPATIDSSISTCFKCCRIYHKISSAVGLSGGDSSIVQQDLDRIRLQFIRIFNPEKGVQPDPIVEFVLFDELMQCPQYMLRFHVQFERLYFKIQEQILEGQVILPELEDGRELPAGFAYILIYANNLIRTYSYNVIATFRSDKTPISLFSQENVSLAESCWQDITRWCSKYLVESNSESFRQQLQEQTPLSTEPSVLFAGLLNAFILIEKHLVIRLIRHTQLTAENIRFMLKFACGLEDAQKFRALILFLQTLVQFELFGAEFWIDQQLCAGLCSYASFGDFSSMSLVKFILALALKTASANIWLRTAAVYLGQFAQKFPPIRELFMEKHLERLCDLIMNDDALSYQTLVAYLKLFDSDTLIDTFLKQKLDADGRLKLIKIITDSSSATDYNFINDMPLIWRAIGRSCEEYPVEVFISIAERQLLTAAGPPQIEQVCAVLNKRLSSDPNLKRPFGSFERLTDFLTLLLAGTCFSSNNDSSVYRLQLLMNTLNASSANELMTVAIPRHSTVLRESIGRVYGRLIVSALNMSEEIKQLCNCLFELLLRVASAEADDPFSLALVYSVSTHQLNLYAWTGQSANESSLAIKADAVLFNLVERFVGEKWTFKRVVSQFSSTLTSRALPPWIDFMDVLDHLYTSRADSSLKHGLVAVLEKLKQSPLLYKSLVEPRIDRYRADQKLCQLLKLALGNKINPSPNRPQDIRAFKSAIYIELDKTCKLDSSDESEVERPLLVSTANGGSGKKRKKQKLSNSAKKMKQIAIHNSSSSSSSSDEAFSSPAPATVRNRQSALSRLVAESSSSGAARGLAAAEKRSIKIISSDDLVGSRKPQQLEDRQQLQQQKLLTAQSKAPRIDDLTLKILSWDFAAIQSNTSSIIEVMSHIPDTFASAEEYKQVFEPLVLSEAQAQIVKSKEEIDVEQIFIFTTVSACANSKFHDITFSAPRSDRDLYSEHDLVALTALVVDEGDNSGQADELTVARNLFRSRLNNNNNSPSKTNNNSNNSKIFLAEIVGIKQKGKENNGQSLEITMRLNFERHLHLFVMFRVGTVWCGQSVASLTTIHRELAAVRGMEHFPLRDFILQPQRLISINNTNTSNNVSVCKATHHLNNDQAMAVCRAADPQSQGFILIQGPPGTGKTKTVLSIVGELISGKQQQSSHILICAPSNAAVDELVRRSRRGIVGADGRVMSVSMIRFGTLDGVQEAVREQSLESQVENAILEDRQLASAIDSFKLDERGVELVRLVQRAKALKSKMSNLHRSLQQLSNEITKAQLEGDICKTEQRRRQLFDQLHKECNKREVLRKALEAAKLKHRKLLLNEAQLVFCTLSMSGHETIVKETEHNFDTVIIDEACQAVELSCLIPLKYMARKCILVGDPNQLPPTVLSKDAADCMYEQSLFERIQKSCQSSVILLGTQYRMHPQISQFPSKIFYSGRLTDGMQMEVQCKASWHSDNRFAPYRFFNVTAGSESSSARGYSLFNLQEAKAIAQLFEYFCLAFGQNMASKVGVITPYREQRRCIEKTLREKLGMAISQNVEVKTIDGFQGQEKDIIIVSCVRSNREGSVGFLSDVRRLNVALTRAKSSLWLFGNCKSLAQNNRIWRELIDDAYSRDAVVDFEEFLDQSALYTSLQQQHQQQQQQNMDYIASPPAVSTPLSATSSSFNGNMPPPPTTQLKGILKASKPLVPDIDSLLERIEMDNRRFSGAKSPRHDPFQD